MTDHDPETGEVQEEHLPATQAPSNVPDIVAPPAPTTQVLPMPAGHKFDQLAGAIATVISEIEPVAKRGENSFQHYKFPRMQDVLTVLSPLTAKHGIIIMQSEVERGFMDRGGAIFATYDFTVFHKSGQHWPFLVRQTGVSRTRDSKGGFDDKSLNKCHTAARKFFLMALFQIPTEDPDADRSYAPRPSAPRTPIAGKTQAAPPDQAVEVPHELKPDKGEGYLAWGERLMAQVLAAKTVEQIDAWRDLNVRVLDLMKRDKPDIHKNILHSIQQQRGVLAVEGAA